MRNIIITESQLKNLIEQTSLNLKGKTIPKGVSAKHSSNYVSKDEENLFIRSLNEIISLHKGVVPIHVRGFIHFLIGKTTPFTERDMTNEEKVFLKRIALSLEKTRFKDVGFNYAFWHNAESGDANPRLVNKNDNIDLLYMPHLSHQFYHFLGQVPLSNIKISPNKSRVTIIDNYDMNFHDNGRTKQVVIKEFEQSISRYIKNQNKNIYGIIRSLGYIREVGGYRGYPVNINL